MIKVVIIDDHQLFIDGIMNSFLHDRLIHVTGSATDGTGALKLVRDQNPDLVILDIVFAKSKETGVDILRKLRIQDPEIRVLVLTGCTDKSLINLLKQEGACGYRIKNIDIAELKQTIYDICRGMKVFKYENSMVSHENQWDLPLLSEKAIAIIQYISNGMTIKEIAVKVGISETTVVDHIERAKRKLDAKNHAELVAIAARKKLI